MYGIPENHSWTPQKRGNCFGHMYTTSPLQGERHYLQILLHHIPRAMSFTDLRRKLPDGTEEKTFKGTATKFGLLETDEEWDQCLQEASVSFMPKQLHSSFITILLFGEPAEPKVLWEKNKEDMSEDVLREYSTLKHVPANSLHQCVENEVLHLPQEEMEAMGSCLENFGLPVPQTCRILESTLSYSG